MVASMPLHDSPLAGDGLGGGAQVVLPIAARDGREGGSPVEFAVSVGFAGGGDAAIGARLEVHADGALERHGKHGEAVIVDVFADQIDAPGGRDHGLTIAR